MVGDLVPGECVAEHVGGRRSTQEAQGKRRAGAGGTAPDQLRLDGRLD